MRWHIEERSNDDILKHLADSQEWNFFDQNNPDFSYDCRNVRLAAYHKMCLIHLRQRALFLVHDQLSRVLIINFPPWMSMNQPYLILSTFIDSPHGPRNNIDVYLLPFVYELWKDGIDAYDAMTNHMFCMHAILL